MSELETRDMPITQLEVRDEGDDSVVTGYAARFDTWSEDLGGFRERIQGGAFKRDLDSGKKIYALWQHRADEPIGHTQNERLRLEEDDVGLRFTIPSQALTDRQLDLISSGTVGHMSFGFIARTDEWDSEKAERTLIDVDLREVSPVTWPAYNDTSVALRALAKAREGSYVAWPNVLRRRDGLG